MRSPVVGRCAVDRLGSRPVVREVRATGGPLAAGCADRPGPPGSCGGASRNGAARSRSAQRRGRSDWQVRREARCFRDPPSASCGRGRDRASQAVCGHTVLAGRSTGRVKPSTRQPRRHYSPGNAVTTGDDISLEREPRGLDEIIEPISDLRLASSVSSGDQGSVMNRIRQRRRRDPARDADTLVPFAEQAFPSADLVLLCSFGPDLARTRTREQLHRALLLAGYRGPLGRHLIFTSPLLRRSGNCYVLRQFEP